VVDWVLKGDGGSGSRCCGLSGLPVPGQEAGEFMVLHPARDDLLEDVFQISEGIETIKPGTLDERGEDRPRPGSGIRAGEQGVAPAGGDAAVQALDRIGVDLDATVAQEDAQPVPMVQGIADRRGERRLAGDPAELGFQIDLERRDLWPALALATRSSGGRPRIASSIR
jgi:hypothetical protein